MKSARELAPEGIQAAKRRRQIYRFIVDYADALGGSTPNIREISEALGYSYSVTRGHILRLCAEGLLRLKKGKIVVIGSEWVPPKDWRPRR